jgi:hypothetical protein
MINGGSALNYISKIRFKVVALIVLAFLAAISQVEALQVLYVERPDLSIVQRIDKALSSSNSQREYLVG